MVFIHAKNNDASTSCQFIQNIVTKLEEIQNIIQTVRSVSKNDHLRAVYSYNTSWIHPNAG